LPIPKLVEPDGNRFPFGAPDCFTLLIRSITPSVVIRTPWRNGDIVAVPPALSQTSGEMVDSIKLINSE
jgi:hypothetical protein